MYVDLVDTAQSTPQQKLALQTFALEFWTWEGCGVRISSVGSNIFKSYTENFIFNRALVHASSNEPYLQA